MEIVPCVTDEDYEAWRQVRIAVIPYERAQSVAEMRAKDSPERLLLVARIDGKVVGSGLGDRSDSVGSGFVMPRVLLEHVGRLAERPVSGAAAPTAANGRS